MSYVVVWIDSEQAKLFTFNTAGVQKEELKRNAHEHHTNAQKGEHKDSPEFYHRVANHIAQPEELLIVGPGMAKKHFKNEIEGHNKKLAEKIVGCENMDHPTDAQIVAEARKFFTKHDLFTALN
jgi:stalled ribosome rescue protein Dom34